jgi:hypothetical protein
MNELTKQIEYMLARLRNSRAAAVIAIMTFSALPVLAIGAASYYSAEKALTSRLAADNLEQTRAIRESMEQYMQERMNDVEALAGIDLLANPDAGASVKAADVLLHFLSVYGMYKRVSVWDSNGRLVTYQGGAMPAGMYNAEALAAGRTVVSFPRSRNLWV